MGGRGGCTRRYDSKCRCISCTPPSRLLVPLCSLGRRLGTRRDCRGGGGSPAPVTGHPVGDMPGDLPRTLHNYHGCGVEACAITIILTWSVRQGRHQGRLQRTWRFTDFDNMQGDTRGARPVPSRRARPAGVERFPQDRYLDSDHHPCHAQNPPSPLSPGSHLLILASLLARSMM